MSRIVRSIFKFHFIQQETLWGSWLTERQRMRKGCFNHLRKARYLGSMKPFSEGDGIPRAKNNSYIQESLHAGFLHTLRLLTPPMETPDPPNDTPGTLKQVVFDTHDIPWGLRVDSYKNWFIFANFSGNKQPDPRIQQQFSRGLTVPIPSRKLRSV